MRAGLLSRVRSDPDSSFKRGASDRQIAAAEKKLGVRFPPSYRQFLLAFNGGEFRFARMYRISSGGAGFFDLIEWMAHASDHWEPFRARKLLLFGDDYSRNYYCFDLSKVRRTGECPIVLWDTSPNSRSTPESANLTSFISRALATK